MRWMYADPNRPEDRERVRETAAKIDAWWNEFVRRADDLNALFRGTTQWDLPGWMQENLQSIDPNLMWEFGPGVNGGHRLVVTPESSRWLRPLVATLLERAPVLAGWEFYSYRLAEDVNQALMTVTARVGVAAGDAATVEVTTENGRVDLRYTLDVDEERARDVAFVLTETLLGESVLDQWIGAIEATRPSRRLFGFGKRDASGIPLAKMCTAVQRRIDEFRSARPDRRCIDREETWTLWKLQPESAEDYAGQADLFVGKSVVPDVWKAARAGEPFFSESFSAHGETFCYLKIDGSEGLDEESFADKSEIEDAVDAALRDARAGCVIGGGTGRRYSYIDLALLDVDRAIPILRDVLLAGNITKRTWLQFFDSSLQAEWVGIHADAPEPKIELV
jgi:hypothetical protein